MSYCTIEDIEKESLFKPTQSDLFYLSDGRTFTQYKDSNLLLKKLAIKINIDVNSNKFRLYLQKNPDELQKISVDNFLEKS